MDTISKPVVLIFHTVLPNPSESLKFEVQKYADAIQSIIVMTNSSEKILIEDYEIPADKITVISHGTHLVPHSDKELLKKKYDVEGRKILSTFGLLSSGKSIETTLKALPKIIENNKDVLFLIIGKTHPTVFNQEGEKYREKLETMIKALDISKNVRFVNYFLPLSSLLEYLQ